MLDTCAPSTTAHVHYVDDRRWDTRRTPVSVHRAAAGHTGHAMHSIIVDDLDTLVAAAFAVATVAALGAAAVVRWIATTVAYKVESNVERDAIHEALRHRHHCRAKR